MNIKDLVSVLGEIGDNRMISDEIVVESLSEGLVKAFRKHINCQEAVARVDIDLKSGLIKMYQQRTVVEQDDDPDLEMALEDAQEIKPDAQLGDIMEEEVDISEFGRTTVTLVKNVMLQKIKEASKQAVYDEYIDKLDELVYGTVTSVEDKFTLIDLGKSLALLPKSEQIPNERYYDQQRLRVVISKVSKDTKGSQLIVSRACATLIKRLFEIAVPEIYEGVVEIKDIAREAGERTKMVVLSHNKDVDAIGACIGAKGSRVSNVISEITQYNSGNRENIDVVEYSDSYIQYVKNILSPANVLAVIKVDDGEKKEDRKVMVVVEKDQLSLAIGKKGINARLAVKLLGRKVEIKTKEDYEEAGIDWKSMYVEQMALEEAEKNRIAAEKLLAKQQAEEERARLEAERIAAIEEAARLAAEEQARKAAEEAEKATEEIKETVEEVQQTVEEIKETVKEVKVEEEKKVEEKVEEVSETTEEKGTKRRKPKLEVKASDYVSKYEELADTKKAESKQGTGKKKKLSKEAEEELELKKKLEALKNKEYDIKIEYSDEELEEFEQDEEHWYDDDSIDEYDEYDDYYEN